MRLGTEGVRDSKINSVQEGWGDRRKEKRLWLRLGGYRCVGRVVALAYEVGGGVMDGSGGLLIGPVSKRGVVEGRVTCRWWCERAGRTRPRAEALACVPHRIVVSAPLRSALSGAITRPPDIKGAYGVGCADGCATLDIRCPCDRAAPGRAERHTHHAGNSGSTTVFAALRLRAGALPAGPPPLAAWQALAERRAGGHPTERSSTGSALDCSGGWPLVVVCLPLGSPPHLII